jgi:hypothetical protein
MSETKFHTHTKQLAESFTPIQNNWQNYGFVYFKLYVPKQQAGRQKTLNQMVASIP